MEGRLTIPTDLDIVPQTLEIMKKWGADALRDADGVEFPEALSNAGAKVYATYYTTRKDNAWARANPEEAQQMYICTRFHTALDKTLSIPLMEGLSRELLAVNERDDRQRWWEVIDRTTGEVVPVSRWQYEKETASVRVANAAPYHEYSVSFLADLIWDPVHMYNAVVNDWKDTPHQLPFDVRQDKTHAWSLARLRRFLQARPYVNVVRFTTFFHQFTLIFDELRREKYVDWYGYSASVSPFILEKFEREAGYPFRPEYIIDEGYYNNQYRIPSKAYLDFMAFQRREVASLARELVQIVHDEGREAMMFLGDHWIGTEPYMDEFQTIGLDAVVGSVGNGMTLRLISDIPGLTYTEGRLLPYFFPDTFRPGGDPAGEARKNWITARRALLRKPLDRIGFGGYLKLALVFPDFVEEAGRIASEFRGLYRRIGGAKPYCAKRVAILNCWGKMRSWGCHMVHHALYYKENYSYAGVIEALSGAPLEVSFLSFDDILTNPGALDAIDVLINVGDMDTAHGGGAYWVNEKVVTAVRGFVARGGGFIGVGQPSAHIWQGRVFQLAEMLGVEKENGFTLGYDRYNKTCAPHFITKGLPESIDFGEGQNGIYALPGASVLSMRDGSVQLAANEFAAGRAVYLSGLPFSFVNARLLYRAALWCAHGENLETVWSSDNPNVDVHAYPERGCACLVNNADTQETATVYDGAGASQTVTLSPGEIRWLGLTRSTSSPA